MAVVGFDFGTTNSLLSIISGDRAIPFLVDGLPTPSVVCYEGTKTIVGRDARERLSEAGLGIKNNLVRSPKALLGKESVSVEGVPRSPVEITADVIRHVVEVAKGSANGRLLAKLDAAVVTIPVNMQGYRRAALRDGFRRAGIRIRQFVHEPLAALYGHLRSHSAYEDMVRRYERQLMLVVDWGGGTLDITLCRMLDGVLFQICNDGTDAVGGDVFDEELRNAVIERVMRRRALQERPVVRADAKTRLLHMCERAKIDLSERNTAQVYVGRFFSNADDETLDDKLSREDVEGIFEKRLDEGLRRIGALLDRAGVDPAQVSLCLAVGGMSNMPAIRARLHEWFGVERVHISSKSATLIAEGAAWIAHDGTNLQLAKPVELSLARNSRLALLRAGLVMPFEGQVCEEKFDLYCVDPRDGRAKFQLETPDRPGPVRAGDPRKVLCTIAVDVDAKAKPFHERLILDVKVDDNLILSASATSLIQRDQVTDEVHDLEFALRLPGMRESGNGIDPVKTGEGLTSSEASPKEALAIRANIAERLDWDLVPGELVHEHDPKYFHSEHDRHEIQRSEMLYYAPCSYCGRASNDPLCKCGSKPFPVKADGLSINPRRP